jgi:cytochrome bd-type quinol oxidase subunit 2
MELFQILVVCVLVGIIASLGTALFHLSSGKGDSRKMIRALTIRVGLSVGLFLLLIGAWAMGIISPHRIGP